LLCRKASKDEEIITMAKSLIKSWKKLVPESGDKKEKEKEKKEEKKEEKEKPASKSFTPSSFSGLYNSSTL
jgi:transcription elongation factor S-II